MEYVTDNNEIKALLLENQRLLEENNLLLQKIRRDAKISLILRVVWFAVLIGLPLALYYFVLEPNAGTLRDAFAILERGLQDLTGLRQVLESLEQAAP